MSVEKHIKKLFRFFEFKSKTFNFCIGIVCASVVIILDVNDSQEYQFAFFYLFPVGLTTWFAGQLFGVLLALICSFAWVIDNHTHYSLSLIWNTVSTIGVFLTISILVTKVRNMWENESQLSRKDFLTGVLNTRAFEEILTYELNRLSRDKKPLTIAYIDVDNFKEINDQFGHLQGDELLKNITRRLSGYLRKTDVVARMGGDEFVILLPGTNQEAAQTILHKLHEELISDLRGDHWSTTFSIGVVTCLHAPHRSDELISIADKLMYTVKQSGKSSIRFTCYPAAHESVSSDPSVRDHSFADTSITAL